MDLLPELLGGSPAILTIREKVGRLLQRQTGRLPPILIQGETGTGKGLLARAVHRASLRHDGPFVDVNCAAIPETLIEAELFGFERGAFTDARQAKPGLFQTAHRGTIFLDEIGLLPDALQAKLLKVIEERLVRRLGSTRSEAVDAWVLAATNEDLAAATRARRFREDLYHRLAVVTVMLPPLRERVEDISVLADHYLARACTDYGLPSKSLTADARTALAAHPWPGNVRELANVMERTALWTEARTVTAALLGLAVPAPVVPAPGPAGEASSSPLEDAVGSVEREHIHDALRQTAWNITRAALRLGISRDTLRYRISKHGLLPDVPTGRRAGAERRDTPARPRPAAAKPAVTRVEPAAPAVVRWERRRLTLLRAALAGSPATDPRLYPSRALETAVAKAESFGGRVEERGPTGLVAVFGLEPVEDAPRRAAHAALAIAKAAERERRQSGEPLAVRLAIDVGHFLVGQAGSAGQIDLDGKRQAWAALEALVEEAPPDAIAVSPAAAAFLQRHFRLTAPDARGVHRLDAVEHAAFAAGRRMATFVGRQHELELLQSRFAAVLRGHGQVVGILGDAGIGKSRLLFEFRQSLRGQRVTYLEGRCQSYGSAIPYLPFLDILRQNFRITESDSDGAIAQKLRLGLEALALEPDRWAPHLLQLFGVKEGTERLAVLSPEAIRTRTFETLRQLGLEASHRRPCIFVIEDLQWIDRTSEECVAALMESLAGVSALFLATYRPGYRPPLMDRSYMTQIALQPLSPLESLAVVCSVLGRDQIAQPLAEMILGTAEGNPFFLEELSRTVGAGQEPERPATVPDTIEAVLLARIDRLPEAPKALLQTASVLGRVVSLDLLGAVWPGPERLDPHLAELTRLEFLYPQGGATDPAYVFTHALTQQVAYGSLSAERRRALHEAAGGALEQLHAGRLEEVYGHLAHQYSSAEVGDRAIEYLTRLAEKAARANAHAEVMRALDEALTHVGRLPEPAQDRARVELMLRQVGSLIALGRFPEILYRLLPEEARVGRLQNPALAGRYHFLLGHTYSFVGDHERAVQHARLAVEEARRADDRLTLGRASCALAFEDFWSGQPQEGLRHGREALAVLAPLEERLWVGLAYWTVGINHAQLGDFAAALAEQARAEAIAEATADPRLGTLTAWGAGIVYTAMGEHERGIEACRQAVARAPDPLHSAIAAGWLGYAYLEKGEPASALPHLEQSVTQLGQFRFGQFQAWLTVFLAEAHRLDGRPDRARQLAEQALAMVSEHGFPYAIGWAERALGRIALAEGDLVQAGARFAEALRAFTRVQARFDVARTVLDMAALARDGDDTAAAASHVAEARRLFRELAVAAYLARADRLAAELGLPDS